ncbi:acetyltransferase, GNAT family protein [Besnoitia besnoiti]|uniref:Acetyltransferase, GNAT family protein n=1 Tax=Besnoitia besnoiti TaxID=94643 RepID=A0A2A9M3A8_BESBE|nr:acetyltransferase, GNAT family protein [Besnoitia besnoiti]PFH32445.1 acetyltransferase, GNAT family protein [Besnoitia besnoiti]
MAPVSPPESASSRASSPARSPLEEPAPVSFSPLESPQPSDQAAASRADHVPPADPRAASSSAASPSSASPMSGGRGEGVDSSPGCSTSLSSSDIPSSPEDDFGDNGAGSDPRLIAAETAQVMTLAASSGSASAGLSPLASSFAATVERRREARGGGGEDTEERGDRGGERPDLRLKAAMRRQDAAEKAGQVPLCTHSGCQVKHRSTSFAEAGEALFASAAAGLDSLLSSSASLRPSTSPPLQPSALAPSLPRADGCDNAESSLRQRGVTVAGGARRPSSGGAPVMPDRAEQGRERREAGGFFSQFEAKGAHGESSVASASHGLNCGGSEGADYISVRPFHAGDAEAVKQLCYKHFRSLTVPSVFFWVCHHSIDLLALFVIALCFMPLSRVLLAGVLFFFYLLLRGVWEFEMYIRRDCPDLSNIAESYMKNKASGFWVAERTEEDSRNPSHSKTRIVGCIGLAPLQNDNKTAQLVRLVVDRSLRRQHIGSLLLNTFINYALQQHYSIVRLYTNNLNNDSIRFAKTKGFELQQVVRRGLMRGDLLKWQKKLEAPGLTQRKSRAFNLPSSVLD